MGCAWATALLLWLSVLAYALLLHAHPLIKSRRLYRYFGRPDKAVILTTFRLGLPVGLSIMIELSMFAGAGFLIAMMGVIPASAHAIAINIASISFMLYMGLGQAVTIRASQLLGAAKPQMAANTVKLGLGFNLALAFMVSLLFICAREELASLFSSDLAVVSLASGLLLYGALFQLADCLQVATLSALRAYHETASPPRYQMIAFWLLGIPLGIGLGFTEFWPAMSGPNGFWLAMVISLFVAAGLMMQKLRQID